MKTWYQTREGANLQHKAHTIANGKRIFLTEAQAKLHGDKVEKSEAPDLSEDAGVKSEYDEWIKTKTNSVDVAPKPIENKGKANTKTK